jgi:hypothetical protein
MKAELWFYCGPPRLFDRLIRRWTRSRFSHVELVVDDAIACSADAWEGNVRIRSTSGFNRLHWEIVPVVLVKDTAWINEQLGKKYDWLGIFGFTFFGVQDKRRWYCSELCAELAGIAGRPISPQQLYDAVLGIRTQNAGTSNG